MASNKTQDLKDFLRAQREKVGTGFTGAPVWVMQKAGKRIWNKKGKRHWRRTDFGHEYLKHTGEI
jgi:ribosomal protein L39E